MFEKKDFNHIDKMQNEMADGIVDASDSHLMLEKLVEIMSETDFPSDESRMEMMMTVVNLCYEKDQNGEDELVEDNIFYTILGLCFVYSNIVTNLIEEGFDMDDYYRFLKSEVLPVMREESKSLPYWEVDGE